MSTFVLTMELGNAAMLTGGDIADRLAVTADKIEADYGTDQLDDWLGLGAFVRDANGNKVGRWGIESPKTAEQIAADVLAEHAIKPEWVRNGEQIAGLLAEAVRAARGER